MRADHQLEGIVSKLASSKYRSGRSKTWLKTKCFTESSFLIIGTARDRKTKAALLGRRQFNWLLASAPSPPIAFNAADKTLTVVVDFDQRLMTLFAVTRQHAPASVRQERMAFQTPEQTPEGPVPAQVPLPRNRPKRPVP